MSATPKRPTARSQHSPVASADMPLLVAVPDAARLLNIGTTLAWDLVRAGEIPSVKLGRRVLVPRAALEGLARHCVSATDQRSGADMEAIPPSTPQFYHGDTQIRLSSSGPTRPR